MNPKISVSHLRGSKATARACLSVTLSTPSQWNRSLSPNSSLRGPQEGEITGRGERPSSRGSDPPQLQFHPRRGRQMSHRCASSSAVLAPDRLVQWRRPARLSRGRRPPSISCSISPPLTSFAPRPHIRWRAAAAYPQRDRRVRHLAQSHHRRHWHQVNIPWQSRGL
jgi:hypothetical protein